MNKKDLIERLRIRAHIRKNASGRKSVQEGKEDRLASLLEEAADRIEELEEYEFMYKGLSDEYEYDK